VLEVFRKALERLDQQGTRHQVSHQGKRHQLSNQLSHQPPPALLLSQVPAHRQEEEGVGDACLQPLPSSIVLRSRLLDSSQHQDDQEGLAPLTWLDLVGIMLGFMCGLMLGIILFMCGLMLGIISF